MRRITVLVLVSMALVTTSIFGCGSTNGAAAPAPPPCDQACTDGVAIRALRETMKLAFNKTLDGKPVGKQDAMYRCPLGGQAHLFGNATSNAVQGATEVTLTYVLDQCAYLVKDDKPGQTYNVTLTGTIKEEGTISVQPTATTSLTFTGDAVTISGTVYDPPIDYKETACNIVLAQNGNQLSGKLCGRIAGLTL